MTKGDATKDAFDVQVRQVSRFCELVKSGSVGSGFQIFCKSTTFLRYGKIFFEFRQIGQRDWIAQMVYREQILIFSKSQNELSGGEE